MRYVVLVAFFISGMSSLVLQNLWMRMLTLVFGGTTLAIVTVLTVFMAGLALGSYLGGRIADRLSRPVLVYGLLEAGIGVYALILPIFFGWLPVIYGYLPVDMPFSLMVMLRFALCIFLLILPTTLMGATLPILSCYFVRQREMMGFDVGILYSVNTFGAVAGALGGGFVLLPLWGLDISLWIIVSILLLLAAVIVVLGWREYAPHLRERDCSLDLGESEQASQVNRLMPTASSKQSEVSSDEDLDSWCQEQAVERTGDQADLTLNQEWNLELFKGLEPHIRRRRHRVIQLSLGITGASAMICQVLWSRGLAMVIGSSTYAFTLILGVFLIGLAGGAAYGARLVKRTNDLSLAWSRLLLATAGAISVGILLFDRLPILFLDLALRLPSDSNALLLFAFKSFVAAIPVLVPTFLMGMFFPLALGMISQYREPVGNSVGMLYMYNTIGSIVGSAIAGFVVIPLLGLQGGLVLCVSLYLFCAWFLLAAEKNERRNSYALFACVGLIGVLLLPTWDSGRMGLGMFRLSRYRSMDYKRAIQTGNVLFYREGVSATVSVEGGNIHRVLKVNGKAEASTVGDRATQISISAIPIAWHRDAQDVAIIGWGSGMTVGAALHFPLRRLDALEIEPAVVAGSKFFEPWNFHPLRDKRLRLIYNDGRNFLATSKQQYDVIISQPSNPWISGVSNLFTREYFELVRRRLRKGGIFCQWVQLYEISDRNVSSILYSLQSVFPYTRLFEVGPLDTDTFIIASMEPQYIDLQHLNKQIKSQRYRELFRQARIVDAHDLLPRFLMGEREIANMHKEFPAPLNTDAYNILEFSTPLDLVKATHDSRWGKVVKAMGRPYQSYLSTDPKSLSVNQRAELLGQVAKAYLRYGDWEQAEKILERAIKLWPELPEQARYRRLVSLMSLLEPEPSLPELSQIKEVLQRTSTQPATPSTPSPRERLSSQIRDYLTGQGFFEKNETDECLYKFEPLTQCADFIRIFPQIWYYMGACSMRKDRYEQAFAYFSRYIREYAIVIPHKSSTQPAPQ